MWMHPLGTMEPKILRIVRAVVHAWEVAGVEAPWDRELYFSHVMFFVVGCCGSSDRGLGLGFLWIWQDFHIHHMKLWIELKILYSHLITFKQKVVKYSVCSRSYENRSSRIVKIAVNIMFLLTLCFAILFVTLWLLLVAVSMNGANWVFIV